MSIPKEELKQKCVYYNERMKCAFLDKKNVSMIRAWFHFLISVALRATWKNRPRESHDYGVA